MKVSIIIPVLNEEDSIAQLLKSLSGNSEIIVVDGGSTDKTCKIAADYSQVINTPRGRALQLNAGATAATGDVLLFLHADSKLPKKGITEIKRSMKRGYIGGGFLGRFDSNHLAFRFGYIFRDLRTRLFHEMYGDQGIFVRPDIFKAMNGYQTKPIMEDFEFMSRLKNMGPIKIIPYPIIISARRYHRYGVIRQHLKNFWIRQWFMLGGNENRISNIYEKYWEKT